MVWPCMSKTKRFLGISVLKQDFPHPRPKGRPPKRWLDFIKRDTGLPILAAERSAQQRSRWRKNRLRSARGRHDLSN